MTKKEAIEILRGVKTSFGRDCILNETQQAINMALFALEKQEAKKPKIVEETEYSFFVDCHTCRRRLINNLDGEWLAGEKYDYCPRCGQKILWE